MPQQSIFSGSRQRRIAPPPTGSPYDRREPPPFLYPEDAGPDLSLPATQLKERPNPPALAPADTMAQAMEVGAPSRVTELQGKLDTMNAPMALRDRVYAGLGEIIPIAVSALLGGSVGGAGAVEGVNAYKAAGRDEFLRQRGDLTKDLTAEREREFQGAQETARLGQQAQQFNTTNQHALYEEARQRADDIGRADPGQSYLGQRIAPPPVMGPRGEQIPVFTQADRRGVALAEKEGELKLQRQYAPPQFHVAPLGDNAWLDGKQVQTGVPPLRPSDTAHDVITNENGMWQWDPETQSYDISLGKPKPPALVPGRDIPLPADVAAQRGDMAGTTTTARAQATAAAPPKPDAKAISAASSARTAYQALENLAKNKTSASDQAMVTQFFDIIRPGSGARMNEAEISRLISVGALPERAKVWSQKAGNREIFTDAIRGEILQAAKSIVDAKNGAVRQQAPPAASSGGWKVEVVR